MSTKTGVHILVFPFPAQGHMLPLLDLTHQLSLHNLTITILTTPKNLPILNTLLSSNPSIQTLVLPFPKHPSLPIGVENVKDIGNKGNIPIISALSQLQGQIIQWFKSHDNPPIAIISDFFLGWTHHLAHQLGIPRIVFYSSGAFSVTALDILWKNADAVIPGEAVTFRELPRQPRFSWEHLSSLFRRYKEAEEVEHLETFKDSMVANGLSWAFVINSFEALEDEFLEYFRKKVGHDRFYGVGPLSLMVQSSKVSGEKLGPRDSVLSWLDGFEDGSVLYVCFGSQKLLTKAQIEALAIGLEMSQVPFVWAVKQLTAQQVEDGYGTVPDGFTEWVIGRGFVITGWVPQVSILGHKAVGGFLSHCGWNSVLEAVTAGVMIVGWPMEADQFYNARLLVEYKGASFQVCEGGDTVPNSTELARAINESMKMDVAERVKAKKLKEDAMVAVESEGSSSRDLVRLVQELVLLQSKSYIE